MLTFLYVRGGTLDQPTVAPAPQRSCLNLTCVRLETPQKALQSNTSVIGYWLCRHKYSGIGYSLAKHLWSSLLCFSAIVLFYFFKLIFVVFIFLKAA